MITYGKELQAIFWDANFNKSHDLLDDASATLSYKFWCSENHVISA